MRMPRHAWISTLLCAGLLFAVGLKSSLTAQLTPNRMSRFDTVRLKNGHSIQGLLLRESPAVLWLTCIEQRPGGRTKTITTLRIPQEEIEHIDRLSPAERAQLAERLKELEQATENERMARVMLEAIPWTGDLSRGFACSSRFFRLESDASEPLVRRIAVRLEQIYAAYAHVLPPRHPGAGPTTIVVYRSLAEYHEALHREGRDLKHPSFYDAARQRILCGSDLDRLETELARIRKDHQLARQRLKDQEREWKRFHGEKLPRDLQDRLSADACRIENADRENQKKYQRAVERLFATLYHEAFHAYLDRYVYPASEASVPRWLNEGLAQIFETAILEGTELRIGHADAQRLGKVKEALRTEQLIPVADLLRASANEFLVSHGNDQAISDRYYLTSWALAFYLTFGREKIGTAALDQYVRVLKQGGNPEIAFTGLVGQSLPAFERDFQQFLLELQSDGRLRELAHDR